MTGNTQFEEAPREGLIKQELITYEVRDGILYKIPNIDVFIQHIVDFHSEGVSIHEENGHYFVVDDKFREMIFSLKKKN